MLIMNFFVAGISQEEVWVTLEFICWDSISLGEIVAKVISSPA